MTPAEEPFKPNLNKLRRGYLDDATYQISRPQGQVVSDKKIFVYVCHYISLSETCDPCVGPILAPVYNYNKLGRGQLV